jgi:phosphoserine phosphatase
LYLNIIFDNHVNVIGSKLSEFNGEIKSLECNCYGESKLEILRSYGVNNIDVFYTDSLSDLPLAEISKSIVLVSGDKRTILRDYVDFQNALK